MATLGDRRPGMRLGERGLTEVGGEPGPGRLGEDMEGDGGNLPSRAERRTFAAPPLSSEFLHSVGDVVEVDRRVVEAAHVTVGAVTSCGFDEPCTEPLDHRHP